MKKAVTGLAIIMALGTTLPAQAEMNIYGKINVSMDAVDYDNGDTANTEADNWQFNTNGSRIGFKGKYDINENLRAIYKIEYQVEVDGEGTGKHWSQRNVYGGFQNDRWGTFIAGQFDTPTKKARGKVDLFDDTAADISYVTAGKERMDNILQWSSPKWGKGFQVNVATMPGESGDGEDGEASDDGFASYWSASVSYSNDKMELHLATDNDVKGTDIIRVSGSFKLTDALQLGVLYQNAEAHDTGDDVEDSVYAYGEDVAITGLGSIDDQDAWVLSLKYTHGKGDFKFQYATADNELIGGGDADVDQWALGYDYHLSKSTKVYAYHTQWDEDGLDQEVDVTSMGFVHKF